MNYFEGVISGVVFYYRCLVIYKVSFSATIISTLLLSEKLFKKGNGERRKRHEEIPQVKMFNPNLYKNKSYDMNFILFIYVIKAYSSYFYV